MSGVHCGSCQAANPAVAKFCMSCGTALAPTGAPSGLRFVTVVFCDIAGSTQLALRFDPQVWHGILEAYFASIGGALVAAGGRLEKFIGDAVVGVFGADTSGEDDALNAVRGALAALDGLRELNDTTVTRHGIRLSIRFGIASGRVVTADRDSSFAIGSVMNRAARLQGGAPPDGAVIDVRTWLLVRDQIRCEPVAPVPAKGFDKPLQAWSVASGTRPARPVSVFVNQIDLLDRLHAAVRDASRVPGVTSIALLGEMGSGKTRIMQRLADDLRRQRLRVLRLSATRTEESQVVWRLRQIQRALGAPATSAGNPSTQELQWDIRRRIREVSRRRPLVILVDDHHRMPPAVNELRSLPADTGPIVFVLAGREPAQDCQLTLRVRELTDADARALLDSLGDDVESHGVALAPDHLVRRSRGNPLFLEQLAALAVDGIDDGVAPSAEAALGARIDRLGTAARHLLACVGAWDRPVGSVGVDDLARGDDLDAVCDLDEAVIAAALGELEASGLMGHRTAAEVAYAHMVLADRARVHVAIARRLRRYARTEPALLDLASAHAVTGWQHWRELSPASAEEIAAAKVAASCLIAAARQAIARSEVREAAALCARARDLGCDDDALTLEIASLETYALGACGRVAEALDRIEEVSALEGNPSAMVHLKVTETAFRGTLSPRARALARAVDDPCATARLDTWEGLRAAREGDYPRAEELLRSAYAGMRGFGAGLGVAEIYGNLSLILAYGNTPPARSLEQCAALRAEVADAPLLHAVVSCPTAMLLQMTGDTVAATGMLADARTTFKEMGHTLGEAGALEFTSIVAELAGDPSAAHRRIREAQRAYQEAGAQESALRCLRRAYVLDPSALVVEPFALDDNSSRETRVLGHEVAALHARGTPAAARHLARALDDIRAVRGAGATLVLLTSYRHVAALVAEPASVRRADEALAELAQRRR